MKFTYTVFLEDGSFLSLEIKADNAKEAFKKAINTSMCYKLGVISIQLDNDCLCRIFNKD